jgi:Flp pilus assembly CpaF family ATPase
MRNARSTFAMAVDMIIQLGWVNQKRRILGVWEIEKMLKDGEVIIHPLYTIGDEKMRSMTVR